VTSFAAVLEALKEAGEVDRLPAPGSRPQEITGLTADSRRVRPGVLYCAVRGTTDDGHRFVGKAAEAGAVAALVESRQSTPIPEFVVKNGRRAAAIAAKAWFGDPAAKLELVGVTGTNGKSTTVGLIRHILSAVRPTGSMGTLGAFLPDGAAIPSEAGNLTTPGPIELQETLAEFVRRGVKGVVMEVSSHSLDQGRVEGLGFRAAVFTNLTHDHLDYHKDFAAYFAAKAQLAGYVTPKGVSVVNADDPAWRDLPQGSRRITFGLSDSADVRATNVKLGPKGSTFDLVTPGGKGRVTLPLLGGFNVANALAAAATAAALDVPLKSVIERLQSAPQVSGRMEVITDEPVLVLRDYAHTPDALQRALETVRQLASSDGRVLVVFGAGGDRDKKKRHVMGRIAAELADVAVVTSDNPRTEDPAAIIADIEAGMKGGRPHQRIVDRREAIAHALEVGRPGDVILLAGKGHETYQVVGTTKHPFDERVIVRDLLRKAAAT
jgi:UDP-N-acetylmuramoyl-L-alanyl-D-glutamate--2,6-diaminopimelate ligase